ncbi:hypothetical protein JK361_06965 [Streptomyces sp. 5-8]|uniref:Lipoprotein n=1 Tax=Streptomyces musisoli TaxID=2802280 RepID=A0ABS1NW66_9ACTN|nr:MULTISPECIES: hypothetical protein [Streptomyces]MBL1104346.1 hypothetical protein [Streptomyces musisoli]MBY8840318.1 hypothetical protein [Streptomyces sp. SP2-10]
MATPRKSDRHRPGTVLRATVLSASAAVLALTLTACGGDGTSTASPTSGHTATAQPGGSGTATGSPTAGAEPADGPTPTTGSASGGASVSAAPTATPTAAAPAKPAKPSAPGAADGGTGCDHKMPISPDEVAVYRYTTEGGSLSLIVKHGQWGCAPADSDGAPFETVGKETYIPLDQAAYVTATNPIVESSENQRIGVQEFLDWLDAHPDSGLVFKYHLGADGAIDSLEEEFTP